MSGPELLAQEAQRWLRFATEDLDAAQRMLEDRFAVIYVARRELNRQQFTAVIDNQMELEVIIPSHTALAPRGHLGKKPDGGRCAGCGRQTTGSN